MSKRTRRRHTSEQKAGPVRQHVVDKKQVSDICSAAQTASCRRALSFIDAPHISSRPPLGSVTLPSTTHASLTNQQFSANLIPFLARKHGGENVGRLWVFVMPRRTTLYGACTALILVMALVAPDTPAADDEERWSFVLTPQVWLSHISKNGFQAPSSKDYFANKLTAAFGFEVSCTFCNVESQSTNGIDPQWGAQLAFQKGAWTFAIAAQYVSFGTRNDFSVNANRVIETYTIQTGTTIAQEFIDTDRLDIDLAGSHFFQDVITNRLDINAGVGVKFIYATASRNWSNVVNGAPGNVRSVLLPFFVYYVCPSTHDNSTCQTKGRVSADDYYYGATLPLTFSLYPTGSSKLVVPVNLSPFLGAETRNDRDVAYAATCSPSGSSIECFPKRVDGTTFAYGVTADSGVRYVFDNGVAVYGGFRVQYFEGFQTYLAWGPIINMSVRFGK